MSSKKEKILVAAIVLGTTHSRYAFSFKHDYEKDPTKVVLSQKQPTCVLCNSKGEFDSFGYDAENKYTALAEDDKHHSWYFFRRFKMVLHGQQIKRGIEVEDDKGLKMPARTIFGMSISYLKKHLLDTLEKQGTGLKVDDIHWILTVPAIFSDSAKQFMREAANEAGIDGTHLTIVLEPEAAAMYCQLFSSDHLSSNDRFDDNKYMVIDLGGGTADITVHEKKPDGTIKEVHKAISGAWGGTKVDEEFNQMIIKIIGAPSFKTFCDENKADHMEMLRELENKKRSIRTDKEDKITIKVPVALKETYEKKSGETIKDAVEQTHYKGKIQWTADKIRIDAELFRSLFQNCIRNITEHVADILEKPEAKGTSTLLMVGGFSECQLIQEAIKKAFPKAKLVIPSHAGLAVFKGAVIFGHKPQLITSRIAKYTYGIRISPPFNDKRHPQDKKKNRLEGLIAVKMYLRNISKLVNPLKLAKPKLASTLQIKSNQKEMLLKIYASPENNPIFVTDSKCEIVGRVVVKLPDTTDPIRVIIDDIWCNRTDGRSGRGNNESKIRCFFDFL